jgi:phosphopantothenoylcysteine decarboxylase/phosphopantothenate--cysteine ligase
VTVVRVSTAAELAAQVVEAAAKADVVVMAAAVADFRPTSTAHTKIKKSDGPPPPIVLEPTPDVLADLLRERHVGQVVVGFAAETGDDRTGWLDLGRAKLAAKSVDLLVVNRVDDGRAFGTLDNEAVILGSDGSETPVELGPKEALADAVWDLVAERLEP